MDPPAETQQFAAVIAANKAASAIDLWHDTAAQQVAGEEVGGGHVLGGGSGRCGGYGIRGVGNKAERKIEMAAAGGGGGGGGGGGEPAGAACTIAVPH
jgi:hypothetical protein